MLDVRIEGDNEFSICRPIGEIDAYTVDDFRQALSSLATVSKLLVDLSVSSIYGFSWFRSVR